ncbi:deoxycytidine triphosphate deaminase [Roseobacter phage RD-1410Ws-07]|uniref:Deoxycytidine triphosphate deaminase n=1 Tax=Roseobacter phage RD-1410Ws-07 TaxID=1815985 RepID=A0A191VYP3_9CAUD|nr:deoxycytidine triphosphate deaminase [Roseobacter phage RD-1410Ws-07]
MIINRGALLRASPIKDMYAEKIKENGYSYGLSEAGYDIRIKQDIQFDNRQGRHLVFCDGSVNDGHFTLASAIEEFTMPTDLVGIVHDKSTWARQGLSVFNTVIEPGWCGFLTLELAYHGNGLLHIPAGVGIAQVVFHQTSDHAQYEGKYQHQEDKPQEAKFDG